MSWVALVEPAITARRRALTASPDMANLIVEPTPPRSAAAAVVAPVRQSTAGDTSAIRTRLGVDLYWIPLGAGGHSVRLNGKVFEAVAACCARRSRRDLYHSALEVTGRDGRFTIEMTPIPDDHGSVRGVVSEGAVGARFAGRFRLFRYEIRRWRDGVIPDAAAAISGPIHVASDVSQAQRLLDLVPSVPTPVWGRDELGAGEMWNSNSVTAWLLQRAGINTGKIRLPSGGRAPGWDAGIAIARRP
jgi:hypothetical protein